MVLDAGMDCHAGEYVSGVITAPGAETLPWDCGRTHRHSGDLGCRVDEAALSRWDADRDRRWSALYDAAQTATKRALGARASLLVGVWEPQQRGAFHRHVTFSALNDLERLRAKRCLQELERLAPSHGFGDVLGYGLRDRHGIVNRKVYSNARSLSRYLSSYFVAGEHGKMTLLETMQNARRAPRRLVWVSPKLTRRSGITMRVLRLSRRFRAARKGLCSYPAPNTYTSREAHAVWNLLGGFGGFQRQRLANAP